MKRKDKIQKAAVLIFITGFLFLAEPASVYSQDEPQRSKRSLVNAGDKLNIQVYQEPDLSGVFVVSSSGEINYPLLGEVYVQDLSLEEVKDFLAETLEKDFLVNPQVEVNFQESPSKSVSVLGEIHHPGNYILSSNPTLVRLISQVGGFSSDALTDDIKVVRTDRFENKNTLQVNVDKIIAGDDLDFVLEPGDIIYVESKRKKIMGQIGAKDKSEESAAEFVTLLGQVTSPGNYHLTKDVTLVRLIGQAGGFTGVAAINRIKIVRQNEWGKQKVFMVDAGKILDGRAKDVELEPGDLVIIPESYF